jgi:aspartate/methionine/tyrosine aminotransferase
VLEPTYATYEAVIGASGAEMAAVPLVPEHGFHPDLDALAAAITPRTRLPQPLLALKAAPRPMRAPDLP